QMAGGPSEQSRPMKGDYSDLLIRLRHYPKPLIARVNGHAMGGGLGIVAASHFAVGLAPAKLGTPEVDVGLFPMMIMRVLAPLMPRRALVRMMLLGERYEAPRAAELGLLGRVVGDIDGLDAAVHELVTSIEAKSPITLRLGLEAMAQQEELSFREALPYLQRQLGAVLATDDAAEGLQAFLQKRPPVWQGK
ncbi:MAG: enoyl-CoA hydratase-related protein, partial [Myxococcota bacterium]